MLKMPNGKTNFLINRDFLFHTLENKALKNLFKKTQIRHQPFITVSREPGSGGKEIAKRLAKHLNFHFFDKEIISHLFEKDKIKLQQYEKLYDEKNINFINELINEIIYPNLLTQDKFVRELTTFITKLTLSGKCVILGRGANFFTDHRFGFHVRITAPFDFRVQKTVQYEHLSQSAAKIKVTQVSNERKQFAEKYFSHHIDNPTFYDLILNRAHYSLEDCQDIIKNAFRKKMKT
jgi:cytidylate kinase